MYGYVCVSMYGYVCVRVCLGAWEYVWVCRCVSMFGYVCVSMYGCVGGLVYHVYEWDYVVSNDLRYAFYIILYRLDAINILYRRLDMTR